MPGISTDLRVLLWIIASISGVVFSILGNEVASQVVYFMTRRGRPPVRRPMRLWILFISSFIISVVSGAIAAFASDATVPVEPLPANIVSIIQSSIIIITIVIGIAILIFLTILLFRRQSNQLVESIQKLKTQEEQLYQYINVDFENLLKEDLNQ